MKSSYYKAFFVFSAIALLGGAISFAKAEENENSPVPLPPAHLTVPAQVKARIETRVEQNKQMRNDELQGRQDSRMLNSSTTRPFDPNHRPEMMPHASTTPANMMINRERMMKIASTTAEMFKRTADRQALQKKMQIQEFENRKNALIKELTAALVNLDDISARIDSRIVKSEGEGHDLTSAKNLFTASKDSLSKAKAAVAAFQAFTASSTAISGNATTTAQIDLAKPRALGDAAIKSVKGARDLMEKVLNSIQIAINASATTSNSKTAEGAGN